MSAQITEDESLESTIAELRKALLEQLNAASDDQALSESISKMRAQISEAYEELAALGFFEGKAKAKLKELLERKKCELIDIRDRHSSRVRMEDLLSELQKWEDDFMSEKAKILDGRNSATVKPDARAQQSVDEFRSKAQLRLVMLHVATNFAVSALNFSTRGELLKDVLGSDYAVVGQYLAKWTGATALLEFLLNPTVGKLSDTYGRKPFMILSPYAALVLKTWVLLKPSLASLTVERIICDLLRTLSGTTMGMAAITDLVPRDELGTTISSLYSSMGVAIIFSPILASRLSVLGSYRAAIFLACFQLGTDQFFLEETLPVDQRRSFKGFSNPFELLRLFTTSGKLAIASATMALQNLMDVKITADPMQTLQLSVLKWTRQQVQLFSALIGLGLIVGKQITQHSVACLGKRGHTTFTHCVTILSSLVVGVSPSSTVQVISGLLNWVGDQRSHFVKEMHTCIALESNGIGKGELSGLQANLRAFCVVIGPFMYAWAQKKGMELRRPGAAFLVVALVAALAELTHQRSQAVART